jgi:hypothetical protein
LWYYGPVIAVGSPIDRLPRAGAARGYFADSEWQNAVTHWMHLARLIVVVVGATDWLRWEIDTAMKLGHLPKLLFIFPPDTPSNRASRWVNTTSPLVAEKYQTLRNADVTFARIGYFKDEGTFVLICAKSKDHITYELALRLAIFDLCHEGAKS